jgi:hypothetical protein
MFLNQPMQSHMPPKLEHKLRLTLRLSVFLISAGFFAGCASQRQAVPPTPTLPADAPGAAFALPPKYLAVKDFQQCLRTLQMGSYSAWCLPAQKLDNCPAASWAQLNALAGIDKLPSCQPGALPAPATAAEQR